MTEIWKTIEDAPNYEVSNLGNIRNKARKKNLKPYDNGCGYKKIAFSVDGKRKYMYVHILVAKAFIPNPHNLPEVSHLDESRDNNRADNLAWATSKENCNMPLHRERIGRARGTPCKCIETGIVYYSG